MKNNFLAKQEQTFNIGLTTFSIITIQNFTSKYWIAKVFWHLCPYRKKFFKYKISVSDPYSFDPDPDRDPAFKAEFRSGSRVLMAIL